MFALAYLYFWGGFCDSFSMLFPEAPAYRDKKLSKLINDKFKLETLIFLSFVVSFLVDMFD